jgi:hypothetical protein
MLVGFAHVPDEKRLDVAFGVKFGASVKRLFDGERENLPCVQSFVLAKFG